MKKFNLSKMVPITLSEDCSKRVFNFSVSEKTETMKAKARVLDLKPIFIQNYEGEDGERRVLSAIFMLDGFSIHGENLRGGIPILMNHYGKGSSIFSSEIPSEAISLGLAKNFIVDKEEECIMCDMEIITKAGGQPTKGLYYASYIQELGHYSVSLGLSADDTPYNYKTGKGNMLFKKQDGTKSNPDILIFRESEAFEVSFVYQGRVESAQAMSEEFLKNKTTKEEIA